MHIILGIIGAIATLAWAIRSLQQAGFTIDSINPFAWYRRHQWRQKYGKNPLYTLENTMDVAAALVAGTARLDGDISREQKQYILSLFETEFEMDNEQAQALLSSSLFLLNNEHALAKNVGNVLSRTKTEFTEHQTHSLLDWMQAVAQLDSPANNAQSQLIQKTSSILFKGS